MIKHFRIKNFKAVGDSMKEPIEFDNITLFAGINSSGKSTLTQALLMLIQTMQTSKMNRGLILNSDLVSLGKIKEMWHQGNAPFDLWMSESASENKDKSEKLLEKLLETENLLEIELMFEVPRSTVSTRFTDALYVQITMDLRFAPFPVFGEQFELHLIQGRYVVVEYDSHDLPLSEEYLDIKLDVRNKKWVYVIEDVGNNTIVNAEEIIRADYEPSGPIELVGKEVRLAEFLPARVSYHGEMVKHSISWADQLKIPIEQSKRHQFDRMDEYLPASYEKALRSLINEEELPSIDELDWRQSPIRNIAISLGRAKQVDPITYGQYIDWIRNKLSIVQQTTLLDFFNSLNVASIEETTGETFISHIDLRLPILDILTTVTQGFFDEAFKYLGSYRIAPQFTFKSGSQKSWPEVGINGGNVATALTVYGAEYYDVWDPIDEITDRMTLIEGVLIWLDYLGLVQGLHTEERGKIGTLLQLEVDGMDVDLTSVGFGTSQVLPIITQGLLTPLGGTFMVEQPESHLHPRLQTKLTDFFIGLAQTGRQVIIETHSEHILNRLLLEIIRAEIDQAARPHLYFVSKNEHYSAEYQPVKYDTYGNIENWPPEFLSEHAHMMRELIREAANKRKRLQSS